MERSQEILLALLRCALWGRVYDGPDRIEDWSAVLRLGEQQTVLGLVADAVPMLPAGLQPDASSRLKLHSRVMRICQNHSLLNRNLAKVKSLMDSHSIRTVLFKGQGLALTYPNPLSRQCGDIDLYVGERNFLKAMDVMEPDVEHDVNKYAHLKHFNAESEGVSIEIHRIAEILPGFRADRMFQQWTVQNLLESELRKVDIGGIEVNLPPVDFDALYIMNHAWHHFMTGGIGLRQLCDWTMYLHRFHRQIDAEKLEKNLKTFGLTRAWQIFGSIAVKHLGLPAEECPLYAGSYDDKALKALEVIWREGNFGKYSESRKTPRPEGHFAGKFFSFRNNTSRIINIMSISPADVLNSWIYYFINGMRNVFVRIK